MRADRILRPHLAPCRALVHVRAFELLLLVVDAVFRSSCIALTALGRALRSDAYPKHRIKRIDRFLGNVALHAARVPIYRQLVARLIRPHSRPLLVLDWTQVVDEYEALWVGMVHLGRTIPVFAEAYRVRKRTKRKALDRFLASLREVLPKGCRPIILVDAEFCTPFFTTCEREGFDFVVRLRGRTSLRPMRGPAVLARQLAKQAVDRPQCFGLMGVYDSIRRGRCLRVVLAKRPRRRYRPRKSLTAAQYRRRALTAWVLATSLQHLTPKQVVNLYAKRMQIEEMFRDAKDARYGWALQHTGSRDPARLSLLLLVASLAMIVAVLLGTSAMPEVVRRLQANTERRRRVLSVFAVGVALVLEPRLSHHRVSLGAVALHLRQTHFDGPPPPRFPTRFGCRACHYYAGSHDA